jgi:hypothetical protein
VDVRGKYEHLRAAVAGTPAVSGVVPSIARHEPVIGFAVPFPTPQGLRVFSGAYRVQDTPLAAFVRNAAPFRTGEVLLVDAPAASLPTVVTEPGTSWVWTTPSWKERGTASTLVRRGGDEHYVSSGLSAARHGG